MPNQRILLVDDEPGIRVTLAANLELEGFDVREAASAEEALDIASAGEFDLVLTDVRMTGMTGVDLFRHLRKRGATQPLILMTAFADEDLISAALGEGVFAILRKPFDVEHLLRTIANAARRPDVVVVADGAGVAESTCAALEASGLRASAVTSGEAAIEALKRCTTDVVVIHLEMATMSGAELAARARDIDPRIAIIAVSGSEVPDMIREIAAVRMSTTFLRKPFALEELVRCIATARGQRDLMPPRNRGAA